MDAIKDEFPESRYDVICFDGAIDHFSFTQLAVLLPKIKRALGSEGVLTGYYQELGYHEPDREHPISFRTKEDVVMLFSPYFKFVATTITETPGRINCYLRCSDTLERIKRFADWVECS